MRSMSVSSSYISPSPSCGSRGRTFRTPGRASARPGSSAWRTGCTWSSLDLRFVAVRRAVGTDPGVLDVHPLDRGLVDAEVMERPSDVGLADRLAAVLTDGHAHAGMWSAHW